MPAVEWRALVDDLAASTTLVQVEHRSLTKNDYLALPPEERRTLEAAEAPYVLTTYKQMSVTVGVDPKR